jgi:16S rRNA G966 N2-methylase RsmD
MSPGSLFSRLVAFVLLAVSAATQAQDIQRTGGPYVPTPQVVVDAMLDVAQVGPKDFVIDLGSGDGRIVLTAAQRYNARGLGIDIDPELVKQSNATAAQRGLATRVNFREQDVLQARIEEATVVTLYLLPGMMQQLQSKFTKELKPGTRIVSHDFPFGEWKPDREVSIDVPEKYGTAGQWKSTIFYWVVPAAVSGAWNVTAPGLLSEPLSLTLEQRYQFVQGGSGDREKRVSLSGGKLEANRIRFRLALPAGQYDFTGVVEGDRMRGEAVHSGRSVAWSAVKATPAAPAR